MVRPRFGLKPTLKSQTTRETCPTKQSSASGAHPKMPYPARCGRCEKTVYSHDELYFGDTVLYMNESVLELAVNEEPVMVAMTSDSNPNLSSLIQTWHKACFRFDTCERMLEVLNAVHRGQQLYCKDPVASGRSSLPSPYKAVSLLRVRETLPPALHPPGPPLPLRPGRVEPLP
ncbi:unnamed protein product [Gadus morhua 'NCC']